MVAVIGDIHGCFFTLLELHEKIKKAFPDIQVYTVGDLVDRGNHSYEVMNFVIENNILFTPGNHDYMMYHFFKEPSSIFARSWIFNGNESTLESYENNEEILADHIEIIKTAPLFYNLPDCFISHAGFSANYAQSLPEDFRNDLSVIEHFIYTDYPTDRGVLWTRDNLLDLGKIQVVGHTKQTEITYVEDSNAAYVDTGACVGNKLSAIIIDNGRIVESFDVRTHLNDII